MPGLGRVAVSERRSISIMRGHCADTLSHDGEVIVAGLDDSAHAAEVLRFALHEADIRGTRLRVVHAWSGAPVVPMTGPGMIPAVRADEVEGAAAKQLQDLVTNVAGDRAD